MPSAMGIMLPRHPCRASASRLGVWAASSSVGPPGSIGSPPRPSATRSMILESLSTFSSRTNCWISMAGFLRGAGGESLNSPIDSENCIEDKWGLSFSRRDPLGQRHERRLQVDLVLLEHRQLVACLDQERGQVAVVGRALAERDQQVARVDLDLLQELALLQNLAGRIEVALDAD